MIDLSKLVTAEMKAAQKTQQALDAEMTTHRDYLAATDWLVIRKLETNRAIPPAVVALRQAARDALPTGVNQ